MGLTAEIQSQCGCDIADVSQMLQFSNLSLSALVDSDISSAYDDDHFKCISFSLVYSAVIYSSSASAFLCSRDFCLFPVRLVD